MGVVKNLMVRVGADVRGIVGGMKTASTATSHAKNSIQKDSGSIKNAVNGAFSGVGSSVRAYSETLQNTKKAHEVAKQNVVRLGDKVEGLKGVYTTVRTAMGELNPAKSLNEQLVEAEKTLTQIEHRRKELEQATAGVSARKQQGATYQKQIAELKQLEERSKTARAVLENLDKKQDELANVKGFDANVSLAELHQKLVDTANELKTARNLVAETGQRIKEMGSVRGFAVGQVIRAIGTGAAQAAQGGVQMLGKGLKAVGSAAAKAVAGGVKRLTQGLKSLASTAVRGIASLPGKLLRIGKSASSGAGGVGKLVRQIRNIGVVSLGMRVAGGMFGRLRSIISSYISSNDQLSAATSLLTKQMGQALEPAIRLVMAAMQQLMPVVQRVSAGVSGVLNAIIGDVGDVQYAFRQLGTYGFDQITKADEEEDDSPVEQEQSALVKKLTGWIGDLKKAFVSGDWNALGTMLGDSINGAFEKLGQLDAGKKVGTFLKNTTTALSGLLDTTNFEGIGKNLSKLLGDLFGELDWAKVGQTLGKTITALPRMLLGFAKETDWKTVGQSIGTMLKNTLQTIVQWVESVDWNELLQGIGELLGGTDWGETAGKLLGKLGEAFGKMDLSWLGALLGKNLGGVMNGIGRIITTTNWKKMGTALGTQLTKMVRGVNWKNLGKSISSLVSGALQAISGMVTAFDWKALGSGIADSINGLDWAGMVGDLSKSVSGILSGALDLLIGFAQKLDWSKLASDLWNGLTGIVQNIDWGELISKAFTLLGSAIAGSVSHTLTMYSEIATSLAQGFDNAKSYFETFIDEAGGNVGEGILKGIGAAFVNIGAWIKENLWEPFHKGFTDTFSGLGEKLGEIFDEIPDSIKRPINSVLGFINGMIEGVCDGINTVIDGLNAIHVELPDWKVLGDMAGQTFGFSLGKITAPKIPMLSGGGVVSEATTAVIGERGKEAVVPLERNTGWMDKVADKVSTKVTGGGGNQPVILQIFLGKRKLTEYVIEDINQITRSTGVCPINV